MKDTRYRLPNDTHIFRMTDDTGMFQHAWRGVPDPAEGYTTDDNARAMIMAALLFEATGRADYLDLTAEYLRFLLYARNGAWFRNFMDYDRRFSEERGSQDCFGRCICALGFLSSCSFLPACIREPAELLLRQAAPGCRELSFLRSKAYAVVGLSHLQSEWAHRLRAKLAADLAFAYERCAGAGWNWFEEEITYCNAVLPWAMLAFHEAEEEGRFLKIGLESLDFLLNATFSNSRFRPVGCKGWFPKGQTAAEFDQQPVEACGTLLACLKAFRLTGREPYRDRAQRCLDWYRGANTLGVSMIDPESGGCMDGLTPEGPNRNQGAESLVSWMIASLVWGKQPARKGGMQAPRPELLSIGQ